MMSPIKCINYHEITTQVNLDDVNFGYNSQQSLARSYLLSCLFEIFIVSVLNSVNKIGIF